MMYLPDDLYATIERTMPIVCVDFVPVRVGAPEESTAQEVGLILRESPFGRVWCHLGGRIRRGESIADALQRHAFDTLSVSIELPEDPQPAWVYQWFPPELAPPGAPEFGVDPRKHAVGLSYTATLAGVPSPRREALDFAFFSSNALPEPLWPGCAGLLDRLLSPRKP